MIGIVFLLVLFQCIFATTTPVSDVVTTDCGKLKGQVVDGVHQFFGVPYAPAPIGDLRWKNSQTLKSAGKCWTGTRSATAYGSSCAQPGDDPSSEDCLFLNVWSPNLSGSLPVMFFIHGGTFVGGSGQMEGNSLVKDASNKGVVLVSINYRLNSFGFLSAKQINRPQASGNYGITDMVSALKWVQNNIAKFGGNPRNVTIFGQSSGGTGVWMLMISPLATGLFHKAVPMSGSTVVEMCVSEAETQNKVIIKNTGCLSAKDVTKCLYALNTSAILAATPFDTYPYFGHPDDFDLPYPQKGPGGVWGIVDGYVVPLGIQAALSTKGKANDVPLIVGSNAQEIDAYPAMQDLIGASRSEYISKISARLNLFNNSRLTAKALQYYSYEKYQDNALLAYETMASDIKTTCGQTHLARLAASTFTSPVYRYLNAQWDTDPDCGNDSFCSHYSWHGMDYQAFMNIYNNYFPDNAGNRKLSTLMHQVVFPLVYSGKLPTLYPQIDARPGHISYLYLNKTVKTYVDYHEEECEFWFNNNFYQYSWNS